ncbi:MAG: uroporphyrinogen decarboxylase family protein [Bacillota bacterium]
MTSKERLLAILRGKPADRGAWAPFLTYWWDNNLIDDAVKLGEVGFKRAVGADLLIRGHRDRPSNLIYKNLNMFKVSYGKTKFAEVIQDNRKYEIYETPIGSLQASYTYSQKGNTWFLQEHPVKAAADFKILAYIAADTNLTPDYSDYEEECLKNPDALYLPLITPYKKSAFQSLLEYWVGAEELYYFLADEPDAVDEAIAAMQRTSMEAAHISANSPAEAFLSWEDTSTTIISPAWYEHYILPEINGWCDIVHSTGKLYVQHACGHLRGLVPLFASSKIDAIESVSDPPTSDIPFCEFFDLMPERIAVIGGIEPTFFLLSNNEELEERVCYLCERFKGKRFILANADSCPPGVDIDKFGLISRCLHRYYGMEPPAIASFNKNKRIEPHGIAVHHGSIINQ